MGGDLGRRIVYALFWPPSGLASAFCGTSAAMACPDAYIWRRHPIECWQAGRWLLGSAAITTTVGGNLTDWNRTDLFNPRWSAHAKFDMPR